MAGLDTLLESSISAKAARAKKMGAVREDGSDFNAQQYAEHKAAQSARRAAREQAAQATGGATSKRPPGSNPLAVRAWLRRQRKAAKKTQGGTPKPVTSAPTTTPSVSTPTVKATPAPGAGGTPETTYITSWRN